MLKSGRFGYTTDGMPAVIDDTTKMVVVTNSSTGSYRVDITVGRNPKHCLAPTWALTNGLKNGALTWGQYRAGYMELLRQRWPKRKAEFLELSLQGMRYDVYLMCFCANAEQCHRSLAIEAMAKVATLVKGPSTSYRLACERAADIAAGKKPRTEASKTPIVLEAHVRALVEYAEQEAERQLNRCEA